jgi:hypothetical protein
MCPLRMSPLGFRVLHHGLSAHPFQVVDLPYLPALGLGVGMGSALMVLGALTLCLVFGRDPDPDTDCFSVGLSFGNGVHGCVLPGDLGLSALSRLDASL